MNTSLSSFDTLEQLPGGETILIAKEKIEQTCSQIPQIQAIYDDALSLLEEYGYPTMEEWQRAVVEGGPDAILDLVGADAETQAGRMKLPPYLRAGWKKQALQSIPDGLLDGAKKIFQRQQWLAFDPAFSPEIDTTFTGGKVCVNAENFGKRITEANTMHVPPETMEYVAKFRAVIGQLRELEKGYYPIPIISKYLGLWCAEEQPKIDDFALIIDCLRQQHGSPEWMKAQNPSLFERLGGKLDDK